MTPRLASDLPAGTRLADRFTVVERLGEGASATVYRAHDDVLGVDVALKVLDPLRGADPVGRLRFERELEVLARIDHPGVARAFGLHTDGELELLALELVEGESLGQRLAQGRLPAAEAVEIARGLALALGACHDAGVLHRDLKPDNVVLHPVRGPVILDFGVAWFGAAANLTHTGAVMGSPQYLAPEAFASSLHDARADLYSLGVVLFEMLTGRPPRLQATVAELALATDEEPPRASSLRPGLPPALDELVARAVAPRPEDRFATAGELARSLSQRTTTRAGVRTRLPCARCHSLLVSDLPFCPGCGQDASWELERGPFSIELSSVPDAERCARWLLGRHRLALLVPPGRLRRRLAQPNAVLAVGVSRAAAELLAAGAKQAGCTAHVSRAHRLVDAGLRVSEEPWPRVVKAGAVHVVAVGLCAQLLAATHASGWLSAAILGALAIGLCASYRRPALLGTRVRSAQRALARQHAGIRARLGALRGERARGLAAEAIRRAAPGLSAPDERGDVGLEILPLLDRALTAAADLDTHAAFLAGRSRSRLAAEVDQARTQAALGDGDAPERLRALEAERDQLAGAAVAHDLAARTALEATSAITAALAGRATA